MILIKKLSIKILAIILIFIMCFTTVNSANLIINQVQAAGGTSVDVIDSIVITELYETDQVLAEWSTHEPDITINRDFVSAEAVKLFINWSDSGGSVNLHEGDYFTFVIPSVFDHSRVENVSNKEIFDSNGNVAATYSIYTNAQGSKETKVVFTEYVNTHTNISGNLWLTLYVGNFATTEEKNLEFIINGETESKDSITVKPEEVPILDHPVSTKYGYPSPTMVLDGYYVFEWNVYLNMDENSNNTGFNTLENFSFEDVIPQDSPHVFITSALAEELNIPTNYQEVTVKEYTGSDLEPPENRYFTFLKRYWYVDDDPWVNYLSNYTLANGVTSTGIDGKNGLKISEVMITDKSISAKLGTLTRPTVIHYYTIATLKLSENSLGDPETVKFFKNTFIGNNNEGLNANLNEYYFTSGGSVQGVLGDYSFTFNKISEDGSVLPNALFSLYKNENCEGGADRFAFSDNNGVVAFNNLAEGDYYFQETIPPEGYPPNSSIYKVEISKQGFIIYYGENFENKLSDQGNRIINRFDLIEPGQPEQRPEPEQPENEITEPGLPETEITDPELPETGTTEPGTPETEITDPELPETETSEPGLPETEITGPELPETGITDPGLPETETSEPELPETGITDPELPETETSEPGIPETEETEPIFVTITGTKKLSGKSLKDGMFEFALQDADGKTIDVVTNDKNGKITFNALAYTNEGIYLYTVYEIRRNEIGIDYNDKAYTVKVTVKQNSDNMLTATTEYLDGNILFLNNYREKNTGGVHLKKYGNDKSIKLFVAGFKLYQKDGTFIGTYITNEKGLIEIEGLDYGKFYFVESNAPDGYVLDTHKIPFTLNGETTQNGSVYVELETANLLEMKVPKTGDDTNIGFYIMLLALSTGIILIILFKLRKRYMK